MAVEFKLRKTKGETASGEGGSVRSFSQSEKRGYIDYINQDLAGDPDIPALPVSLESDDIFTVISEGILFCKMINKTFPGTIDEAKLAKKPKNVFEINLNHDVCLEGAKAIGCSTVNIGAGDLREGKQHLVMGLMWQVIKACLMYQISQSMDLQRLADADETIEKVPPEQILLRWFNYHLKNAGHSHRAVTNFSEDIADGECYAVLFSEIAPETVTPDELEKAFRCKDPLARAELILSWAERLNCKKFVSASDIVEGNPRLNLAFVATLFQRFPKLGPTPEELVKQRLNDAELKLEEAENLLADTIVERDTLQADLDKTKLDFDSLSLELGDLKLDFNSLQAEKDSALSKVGELEQLLSSISDEKSSLVEELNKTKAEKDDLFLQLEKELSFKLDLEDQLSKTQFELSDVISKTNEQISGLQAELDSTISLKNDLSATLEETMLELEQTRAAADQKQAELLTQLQLETEQKEALRSELDSTKAQLTETARLQKEAEQTKDDLFKLLTDTISELETTKKAASEKEDNLETELQQERKTKEEFALKLKERNDHFDKSAADWADERARLLARIKELEDELETLKVDMRTRLEESERAKEEALARARELMEQALSDAENEKDAAIDKMRLLLTTNQKQGYLHIYMVSGLLGTKNWTKRYFVLRDNLLAWFKSDQHLEKKPLGVIYCEEARLYEMDEADVGRPLCFQISSGNQKWNVAAESLEEMRSWMTEIRVAKKRKLGVQVVGGQGRKHKGDKGDKGDKADKGGE